MSIAAISRKNEDKLLPTESSSAANPSAGAEWTITVPAGERWLLKAVTVALVQGITQTPWPRIVVDDGTNTLFAAHSGTAAQPVSTTCQHSWVAGGPQVGPSGLTTAVIAQGTLPDGLVLEAGSRIISNTAGIGANSDYGAPRATYVKLPASG